MTRDGGGRAKQGKIKPRINKSGASHSRAASGAGEPGGDYDALAMAETGLAKRSMDYTAAIALTSLGMMFVIMVLHGFSVGGFHMNDSVLGVLAVTLSAITALKVIGKVGDRPREGK